jgi:hypothetical protein
VTTPTPPPPPRDIRYSGDGLDWLHEEGKRFAEEAPQLDVEETLRIVRATRDADSFASSAPDFWHALTPVQQQAFRSRAEERSFAGGARLMREGEAADHVMVILRGQVEEIRASEGGAERVIAHRGPGQLVGERAILEVRQRSATATVVATGMVSALVMTTEDFALFVTEHPAVLDIIERQIQRQIEERRTQDPVGYKDAHLPQAPDIRRVHIGDGRFLDLTPAHPHTLAGQICLVIFTDVAGYSSPERTDEHRRIIRQASFQMTASALAPIWDQCFREDRGDGLLVVVPPTVPVAHVLEYLHDSLPKALRWHNSIYAAGAQIQLRVALDAGPVMSDDLGVSGGVINNAMRLLEAPPLRDAAANRANLGFVVSDFVYQTAIRHGSGDSDPGAYTEVEVKIKKASLHAWMRLVDPALPVPHPDQ